MNRAADRAFLTLCRDSPVLAPVLECVAGALPEVTVAAGAVLAAVWNPLTERPAAHGIKDLDIVYYDASDLSAEAEAAAAQAIARHLELAGLAHWPLDVKNQARVHLWYEARFGKPTHAYRSVAEGIATWPTTSAVGLAVPTTGTVELVAPFGCVDAMALRVAPNRVLVSREVYERKAASWQARWPELTVAPW